MARKPQKDRTSIVIATVLHVVLIGGVGYWAYKTGKFEQMRQAILQYVKGEKKEEKKPEPVQQKQTAPPKLPPINQGVTPSQSSGTRRAVASDAPESHGGASFFQDTRKQGEGSSTGGGAARQTNAPLLRPLAPPAVRPTFAPPPKTTIKQLLAERSKEAASVEAVGTEQISKSGSSDASSILTKVSGASIVDGKFAVIRGLTDRYVGTTMNGAEVPSSDPYRRSASLDQFPAQIISKLVVTKTFTPDKPGTFTGGGIDIVTRSFPDEPFVTGSVGLAYNNQATLNPNFLTYDGGGSDWLGRDDGTRSLPPSLQSPDQDIPNAPVNSGTPGTPTYTARVNDANYIQDVTRELGVAQFAPTTTTPGPDQNFAISAGETTHVCGLPLGLLGAFNYRREFRFQEDQVQRRWKTVPGGYQLVSDYEDTVGLEVVNWSAMASVALQWQENHDFGINFLYNQNSSKIARQQTNGFSDSVPDAVFTQDRLQWIERSLNTVQFKGTDLFPTLGDLQMSWVVARTATSQDEPDTRIFNYYWSGIDYEYSAATLPSPQNPTRNYRFIDEDNLNPLVDLTLPIRQWSALSGELKGGWLMSTANRSYFERQLFYQKRSSSPPFDGDPNNFLTEDNLGYTPPANINRTYRFDWLRYLQNADSTYDGESTVQAGYLMADLPLNDWLRFVGGARLEATDIHIDSTSYIGNDITGLPVNSTDLQQTDLLPAVGLITTLRPDMNLRVNYSQTIARPSFRELAAVRNYDPILDVEVDGNPTLVITHVQNYDVRWEWFPRAGELLGASFFYKSLENPIERYSRTADDRIITYINRESGVSFGFELEARRTLDWLSPLLADWSIGGNLTWIHSDTELTPVELFNKTNSLDSVSGSRPLYDTSPYLANADLTYENLQLGTTASLIFNVAGPRIVFASQTKDDVYEQAAPTLDFVISQRLGRSLTLRFTARNLLNPVIERTYGAEEKDFTYADPSTGDLKTLPNLYSTGQRGITFGLSATYEF